MFLLPKALQKAKRLSTTNASLPREEVLPQSTLAGPGSSQGENPITQSFPAHSSVLVENPGAADPNPTTEPTVIEDSHLDSALMSGQVTTADILLSPCNSGLPPLHETQISKHMTDPSPFSACITKQRHPNNPGMSLHVGGHLTMVVDGREITGRVMEIQPTNGPAVPPGWKAEEITNHELVHRSTHYPKGWYSDDHIPSVHRWVESHRRESKPDLRPTPYRLRTAKTPDAHAKRWTPVLPTDENATDGQDTTIVSAHQHQEVNASDVHPIDPTQNSDDTLVTSLARELTPQLDVCPSEPLTVTKWQDVKINPSKTYQCGGVLGKGSFAKVYLVLRTADKRQFAMKIHDFRHRIRIRNAKALLKELAIQKSVAGLAFLSGLIDIWYSSAKFLHVTTEYCPGGNLLRHVGQLTDKQMFLVVAEVILGLISLHEKGIIHQDIKPDNILIDGAGHCVITDFGLSTSADVQSNLLVSRRNPPGGTPDYSAPEIRLTNVSRGATEQMFYWDHSADYWSLGATIFHLQTRELITSFTDEGWKSGLDSPMVQQVMMQHRTPSTLITLVEKFTRYDRTRRWKGPRVKEADYFHVLNSSSTAWFEIYAKKYAPFRLHHALPVTSDMPSQTSNHNDPRAQPGQEAADMNNLVDALRTRGMMARMDDSLMPQSDDGSVGDFIPREFPARQAEA